MQVTDKAFLSSIKQVYITVYLLGRIKIMFFMQEKKEEIIIMIIITITIIIIKKYQGKLRGKKLRM